MNNKIRIARLRSGNFVSGPEKSILTFCSKTKNCAPLIISFHKVPGEKNAFLDRAKDLGIAVESILMRSPFDFKSIDRLAKLLIEEKIQILHTHGFKEDFVGYFAAKKARIPAVAMTHGWTAHTLKVKLYEMIDRMFLKRFDKVIIVADFIRRQLVKAGVPEDKIVSIHNAIDFSRYTGSPDREKIRNEFHTKENDFLVGSVGRLSVEKGHRYLLQAAALLKEDYPDLKYIFVGDGPEKQHLVDLTKDLGLEDHVIFAGRREDINDFFAAFDLFVLPSLREFLPNVVLEAFISRVPVVATSVGGVPELVFHNETGLLCGPKDPQALAQNIRFRLENKEKAQEMTQKAYTLIEREFSADERVRRIEAVYGTILDAGE